jgi:hypothetical protein
LPARIGDQSLIAQFHVTGNCATEVDDVWECWSSSGTAVVTSMQLPNAETVIDNCLVVVDEHVATALPHPQSSEPDSASVAAP